MKITDLKEGLEILIAGGFDHHIISAEHDVIYLCGADEVTLAPESADRLHDLGFVIDKSSGSWACYP